MLPLGTDPGASLLRIIPNRGEIPPMVGERPERCALGVPPWGASEFSSTDPGHGSPVVPVLRIPLSHNRIGVRTTHPRTFGH